ncbi:hypothetical protein VTK26DRAFT_8802 [Humicola hyalothermophila]
MASGRRMYRGSLAVVKPRGRCGRYSACFSVSARHRASSHSHGAVSDDDSEGPGQATMLSRSGIMPVGKDRYAYTQPRVSRAPTRTSSLLWSSRPARAKVPPMKQVRCSVSASRRTPPSGLVCAFPLMRMSAPSGTMGRKKRCRLAAPMKPRVRASNRGSAPPSSACILGKYS